MANKITLHNGDSAEVLKQYPDNHFDSIVTDPPYGIEFLGKEWDKNTGAIEVWRECLRVLKPGGHILAFSAARTYHRLATNLEDVGFEIRDQIMWIYGSGFPKGQDMGKLIEKREGTRTSSRDLRTTHSSYSVGSSTNCSKCQKTENGTNQNKCKELECPLRDVLKPADNEWSGWKTGLKPAHEPIVMARKPFKGSTVDNVLKHGTGAINIEDTRVGIEEVGRYPANVIMSEEEGKVLDEKTGIIKSVGGKAKPKEYDATGYKMKPKYDTYDTGAYANEPPRGASKYFYCPKVSRKERHIGYDLDGIHTNGGAMFNPETGTARAIEQQEQYDKYFYNPKVSRKERNIGCEELENSSIGFQGTASSGYCVTCNKSFNGTNDHSKCSGERYYENKNVKNNHPTVKPVALMKYLVTLVTPKGGKVLDPFNGSGSTGMAVKEFGGEYTGIDLDANYIEIASKRIEAWK